MRVLRTVRAWWTHPGLDLVLNLAGSALWPVLSIAVLAYAAGGVVA